MSIWVGGGYIPIINYYTNASPITTQDYLITHTNLDILTHNSENILVQS